MQESALGLPVTVTAFRAPLPTLPRPLRKRSQKGLGKTARLTGKEVIRKRVVHWRMKHPKPEAAIQIDAITRDNCVS